MSDGTAPGWRGARRSRVHLQFNKREVSWGDGWGERLGVEGETCQG